MRIYCEICTELFDETKYVASTPCGHVFHESCIKKWFNYSLTCPKCRNPVEEAHTIRLFFSVFASQAESNEYLENEVNSLKALVHSKNLEIIKRQEEIIKRQRAEAEVKRRILEIKMHATRLEQRINYIQVRHLKAMEITMDWGLSLKKAMENLINATRIMRNVWERNTLRQRKLEIELFQNAQVLDASQYVPLACNGCSRNTRSRNSSTENIASKLPTEVPQRQLEIRILKNEQEFEASQNTPSACYDCSRNIRSRNSATETMVSSNLPSDIRRRLLEIESLNDTQEFEAPQNISRVCNLCSRNTRCRTSAIGNMAPNLNMSSFLSDHIVLSNRCRRSYNPYGFSRSRNIFIRRDEEFSRLSEMPATNSMEINTHSGRISANSEREDNEVVNASAMDQN